MSFKGKTFLVTGGAGFIGSHLVDALVERGGDVWVVDNLSAGSKGNVNGKAHFIRADVKNRWPYYYIDGDVDCIFHEAALGLVDCFKDPVRAIETNCVGTWNVLEYALQKQAKFVLASVGNLEDRPHLYGYTKAFAEQLCSYFRKDGLPVTVLRYFNVYGPRQAVRENVGVVPIFVERALKGKPLIIHGDGRQRRVFTYVSDVVDANLAAYERMPNGVYPVASKENYSILEVADKVCATLGVDVPRKHSVRKVGDVDGVQVDTAVTLENLGVQPEVSLDEGLRRYVEWRRSAG